MAHCGLGDSGAPPTARNRGARKHLSPITVRAPREAVRAGGTDGIYRRALRKVRFFSARGRSLSVKFPLSRLPHGHRLNPLHSRMLLGTNSAICRLRLCSASACILSAAQWAGLKSEIHRPLLGHILNLSPGTGRRLNLSADAATLSSLYLMLERLTVEASACGA